MSWHYRNANSEQGKLRARELFNDIHEYAAQLGIQLLMGNKIVEAKVTGANKGLVVKNHIFNESYDFIFAVGDDKTDEDMFRYLAASHLSFTVKVGPEASFAKYNLLTTEMVVGLLASLSNLPRNSFKLQPPVNALVIQ
jgi:trehalose 6-phosphate synthase/phosphatase